MANKNIITVFGATGNQGGSVAQAFLNDPKLKNEWAVRGVTRDTSKDASKKLAAQGAEMVSADLNDKASLVKAMTGAYAVFAVTNYWETLDDKLEIQQGKNLADAAKVSALVAARSGGRFADGEIRKRMYSSSSGVRCTMSPSVSTVASQNTQLTPPSPPFFTFQNSDRKANDDVQSPTVRSPRCTTSTARPRLKSTCAS